MISTQQLWDLGYLGAVILLTEDWRQNRHIRATKTHTLCGKPIRKEKMLYKDGKFIGYAPGSAAPIWGFYSQRCKNCLRLYLQHRLSPKGKKMLQKARALRWLRTHTRPSGV
jgi:hypothetical protein